jgi:signal transduction histidine kinase
MPLFTQKRQALLLTIGVWALAALLYLVPYVGLTLRGGATANVMAGIVSVCVGGALLSPLLRSVARLVRGRSPAVRTVTMAWAVIVLAFTLAIYDYLTTPLLERFFPSAAETPPLVSAAIVVFSGVIWPFAILAAFYSLLESGRIAAARDLELAEARERASKADAAASAAQLAALRYQLNPHFLFNTLNAISSLIVTRDYADADAMLAKLSEFLRATLGADPEGLIALEDELATLQHYLEIESIRFGERLEVEFSVAPSLHDALVPSFVLQPLVENAIKYAVAPSKRPVMVRVEAMRDGDDLVVMIEDDGEVAGDIKGGTGVGLVNVRRRLQMLFGERGSLEAVRRERGFIAIVRLPHMPRLHGSSAARVA